MPRVAAREIAPDAEHALHMPSHIFVQLGLWRDVVTSNERAWAASRAEVAARNCPTPISAFTRWNGSSTDISDRANTPPHAGPSRPRARRLPASIWTVRRMPMRVTPSAGWSSSTPRTPGTGRVRCVKSMIARAHQRSPLIANSRSCVVATRPPLRLSCAAAAPPPLRPCAPGSRNCPRATWPHAV